MPKPRFDDAHCIMWCPDVYTIPVRDQGLVTTLCDGPSEVVSVAGINAINAAFHWYPLV